MKISEQKLEQLLSAKRAQSFEFDQNPPSGLQARIVEDIRSGRRGHVWRMLSLAASILLLIGVGGWWYAQRQIHPGAAQTAIAGCDRLEEAVRLFGQNVGLVFFDDDLITGERLSRERPVNRLTFDWHDRTGKVRTLSVLGADSDSIMLDNPELSGVILFSRSDDNTLVVELDLVGADSSQKIRDIIVLPKKSHSAQTVKIDNIIS